MSVRIPDDYIDAFASLTGVHPDDRTFNDLYELAFQNAMQDYQLQKRLGKNPRTVECMKQATIQALKLAYAMGNNAKNGRTN